MTAKSYSVLLRELSKSHYNHQINFEDYRAKRREILNKVDLSFNRCSAVETSPIDETGDNTVRNRSKGHENPENDLRLGDTLTMPAINIPGELKSKI